MGQILSDPAGFHCHSQRGTLYLASVKHQAPLTSRLMLWWKCTIHNKTTCGPYVSMATLRHYLTADLSTACSWTPFNFWVTSTAATLRLPISLSDSNAIQANGDINGVTLPQPRAIQWRRWCNTVGGHGGVQCRIWSPLSVLFSHFSFRSRPASLHPAAAAVPFFAHRLVSPP